MPNSWPGNNLWRCVQSAVAVTTSVVAWATCLPAGRGWLCPNPRRSSARPRSGWNTAAPRLPPAESHRSDCSLSGPRCRSSSFVEISSAQPAPFPPPPHQPGATQDRRRPVAPVPPTRMEAARTAGRSPGRPLYHRTAGPHRSARPTRPILKVIEVSLNEVHRWWRHQRSDSPLLRLNVSFGVTVTPN